LIEAEDEIAEMKRKFKIMNHQIEQLKEEITAKDHALVKEHFEHKKVEKERDSLKEELQELKGKVTEADETISSQVSEVQKLTHIINEADAERSRMKKEYVTPFPQCIFVTFCACTTRSSTSAISWARSSSAATTSSRCCTRRSRSSRARCRRGR
jgi:seryl-tRNA synthetase